MCQFTEASVYADKRGCSYEVAPLHHPEAHLPWPLVCLCLLTTDDLGPRLGQAANYARQLFLVMPENVASTLTCVLQAAQHSPVPILIMYLYFIVIHLLHCDAFTSLRYLFHCDAYHVLILHLETAHLPQDEGSGGGTSVSHSTKHLQRARLRTRTTMESTCLDWYRVNKESSDTFPFFTR